MTRRQERLQEEIRNLVTQILLFELEDPRIRGVTVTRVTMTKDLGFARIYYEIPAGKERAPIQEGLNKASGFVRRALAKGLQLRIAPQIEFFYDETSEEIARVEELFTKL